jgi:hypothetical protein
MDLSWTSMLITQVLTILYVAWLTASLRGTQQNMDKYVENYVSNQNNERFSLSLSLYTVFVVVVFFCFFPDQSCR